MPETNAQLQPYHPSDARAADRGTEPPRPAALIGAKPQGKGPADLFAF
jgi:hypothetical protein